MGSEKDRSGKHKSPGYPVGNQDKSKRGLGDKNAGYDGRDGKPAADKSKDTGGYPVGNQDPDKRGRGK